LYIQRRSPTPNPALSLGLAVAIADLGMAGAVALEVPGVLGQPGSGLGIATAELTTVSLVPRGAVQTMALALTVRGSTGVLTPLQPAIRDEEKGLSSHVRLPPASADCLAR